MWRLGGTTTSVKSLTASGPLPLVRLGSPRVGKGELAAEVVELEDFGGGKGAVVDPDFIYLTVKVEAV